MGDRPRGRAHGGQGGAEPRHRIRLRELQVLDQVLAGRSQHRIAASVGITQAAVSKIVKRIEERLLADVTYKADRQRARQTLQLGYLYAQAMDAWHGSQGEAVRRRQRKTHGSGGQAGAMVAEIVAEDQHGDPRYLEIARKVLADLRGLWGLEAPTRIEALPPYATMSDAALAAELATQERLLGRASSAASPVTEPAPAVGAIRDVTGDRGDEPE